MSLIITTPNGPNTPPSLPRLRENNRQAPSLYEYNLLVQKVNRLEQIVNGLRTGNTTGSSLSSGVEWPVPSASGQVLTMQSSGTPYWATPTTELPSNANKTQWMVLTLSASVGAANDNSKWSVDWLRMHT